MYKFSSRKYVTKEVIRNIPNCVQQCIWDMIDAQRLKKQELDYLLVIRFGIIDNDLNIVISQEQPLFEMSRSIKIKDYPRNISTYKVYIIDNEDHVTMMMSDEY